MIAGVPQATASHPAAAAHVTNSFHFTVAAPMSRIAPLFAPVAEREWAGDDWQPSFLWPQPERDTQGGVFTLDHGSTKSIWINTLFDPAAGRMQYVYVIPNVLTTVIDVRVTAPDAGHTAVDVTYTRTALDPAHNAEVLHRGEADRGSGPEWKSQIDAWLAAHR